MEPMTRERSSSDDGPLRLDRPRVAGAAVTPRCAAERLEGRLLLAAAPAEVDPAFGGGGVAGLTPFRGEVHFTADTGGGRRLYRSGGTTVTPVAALDARELTALDIKLFFVTTDGPAAFTLWAVDATHDAPQALKTFSPTEGAAGAPRELTAAGERVYFSASDGAGAGVELWTSDGTPEGTVVAADVAPGPGAGSRPAGLTAVRGGLAFWADHPDYGYELWKPAAGGGGGGAALVKDVNPGPAGSVAPPADPAVFRAHVGSVDGRLYFAADDGARGTELWTSDGTTAGTAPVAEFAPGPASSDIYGFAGMGGEAYFFAPAPGGGGGGGGGGAASLWKTDGTPAGTEWLATPAVHRSGPAGLTNVNGTVFFRTDFALWASDGTPAGTRVLREFDRLPDPTVTQLAEAGGRLYFGARHTPLADGPGGATTWAAELWESDGTPAGTRRVSDLGGGRAGGDSPRRLTNVDGALYFGADRPASVSRLWHYRPDPQPLPEAPADFGAAGVFGTRADLAWTDPSNNEEGFTLERATNPAFAPIDRAVILPPNTTTYADTGLAAGGTYYYRLRAYITAGTSAAATAGPVPVPAAGEVPAAPTGLTATAVDGGGAVRLNWTPGGPGGPAALGQRVQRSRSRGFETIDFTAALPAAAAAYQDTTAAAGVRYFYRVWAVNSAGNSGLAEANLRTPAAAPAARVVGRFVFYNNSAHDTGDGHSDDTAVAPDKSPLLPGGLATAANYTSYSHGINGVMVDLADLGSRTPAAGDFGFRVGNGPDPSAWATAAVTPTVSVRRGEGTGGADRVTITWPDGAIRNTWLQVTALATGQTGLATADVFYFGNAVGETFNSVTTFRVDSQDVIRTRNAQLKSATIQSLYDHNRDGRVNSSDQVLSRNNQTFTLAAMTAPATPTEQGGPAGARTRREVRPRHVGSRAQRI